MRQFTLFHRFNKKQNKSPTTGYSCLYCLVEQKKWKKVIKTSTANNDENHIDTYKCKHLPSDCDKYPSVLHYACKLNPSLSSVKALAATNIESVFQQDFRNRTPLHIACEYGVSLKVIRYLVRQNQKAVMSQDIDGNLPFHLVFINQHYENEEDDNIFTNILDPNVRSLQDHVTILCEAEPTVVMVRNARGMNAWDLSRYISADACTMRVIQVLTRCIEQGESSTTWLSEFSSIQKHKLFPV